MHTRKEETQECLKTFDHLYQYYACAKRPDVRDSHGSQSYHRRIFFTLHSKNGGQQQCKDVCRPIASDAKM